MEPLPPIPTPPAQRWREFRIQVLPLVIFLITLLAIILMWRNFVQPSGVVGEVEALKANVLSSQDGLISQLDVDRFQFVAKDEPIGTVDIVDPAFHTASLAVVAADLKLLKTRMDVDKTRNFDAYARKQLELVSERLNLTLAKTRLVQAESEFKRTSQLFEDKVVPIGLGLARNEYGLDVALRDRDALSIEITDRGKLIQRIETDLKEMETSGIVKITPEEKTIEDAIKAQQEQLRISQKPFVLKAPMDGVISTVFKRAGERVVRGEPILTISSPNGHRILGYLRQPVPIMPTTNDTVVVRTRSQRRMVGESQILKVGAQFEPITPALLADPNRLEVGLPFLVSLPPGMTVTPGEIVDLSIRYAKR